MSGHLHRAKLVKEAFNVDKLATICMASEDDLKVYGTPFFADQGKGKFAFYFRDNDADILAIAHMDSVQKGKDFGVAKYISGHEMVLSPSLDDRLGVYVICELLPALGIKTDILLTTDEESGNSTAKMFQTDKKYKWMFQFDRAGTDVVMYQYKTDEAFKKLTDVGFKTAFGSASDISKLGDLGCLGFNFGVGYEDYHTPRAYAWTEDIFEQVARFMKFHKVYSREHMAYDKAKPVVTTYYHSTQGHSEVWAPHQTSSYYQPHMPDYESDFGRRIKGTWYSKTVWSEKKQMYTVNFHLYEIAPDTEEVPDEVLLKANEIWNNKEQKFKITGGRTPAEILTNARTEPPILQLEAADPKGQPFGQSEAIVSTSGGSIEVSRNEPCICGHSGFVHTRMAHVQGGRTLNACDFWKCNCKNFLSVHPKHHQRGN